MSNKLPATRGSASAKASASKATKASTTEASAATETSSKASHGNPYGTVAAS